MAVRIAEEQLADSRVAVDTEVAQSEAAQVSFMAAVAADSTAAVEVDSMVVAATAVAGTGNISSPS